jgi:lipid A 3-O-deacylase
MSLFRKVLFTSCLLGVTAVFSPAQAESYVVGYAGEFAILDDNGDQAAQVGAEYRGEPWSYGIRPTVGINATTDSAVYGYAGINWDVPVYSNNIYLTPNFMAGAYHNGSGKDLGHALEFRSGIELSYQMQNHQRVGIAFNHISNASLGNHNPGAETLLINYQVPTGQIW